jgi:PRTRC genetic system protein A
MKPSLPAPPPPSDLQTPVLLKTTEDMPWPEDQSVFHLVTADGLYLCRNHEFFVSSVATNQFPQDLAGHRSFLRLRYPRIPQRTFERIIGFFSIIGEAFGAEAAVLLAWNPQLKQIEILVPEQRSLVSSGWGGKCYPLSVEYDMPALPAGWRWIGDLHSHVDEAAYSSYTDERDERHRPGLHIVVGRISQEPPEFHVEVIVDGVRFRVREIEPVVDGYEHRRGAEVPREWVDKVSVYRWGTHGSKILVHPPLGDPERASPSAL